MVLLRPQLEHCACKMQHRLCRSHTSTSTQKAAIYFVQLLAHEAKTQNLAIDAYSQELQCHLKALGVGAWERTSKEIEMHGHLCGNRWVGKASDLMCCKDVEGIVPAGQHT